MKEKMPCIAHAIVDNQLEHFVVIYKIDAKEVLIGDPAKGLYKISKDKFLEIWKKQAVILLSPIDKLYNINPPNWLSWIFAYFKKEEAWLYQSVFLGILYTILAVDIMSII